MTHEIHHTLERGVSKRTIGAVAGAVLFGLALEAGAGTKAPQELDAPSVIYKQGDADSPYKILFFPGSCTNIEGTADHFHRLYGSYGSLYMVNYQKRGFDHEALKPAIVQEFDQHEAVDGDKQTVILTQSLGGPVSNALRLDSSFSDRIGTVAIDLEDSPPMHPGDLRLLTRVASIGAARLPDTKFTDTINRKIMQFAVRNGLPHSTAVTQEDADNHGLSTALTPFAARKGQTRFINKDMRRILRPGMFAQAKYAADETYVLSSEYDAVLDPDKAARRLSRIWGTHVLRLIEMERTQIDPGNHGGIFEFPRAVMGVLERQYSEAYRTRVPEIRIPSVAVEAEAMLKDAEYSRGMASV